MDSLLESLDAFLSKFIENMNPLNRFFTCSGLIVLLIGVLLISLCLPGSQRAGQFLLINTLVFPVFDAKMLAGIFFLGVVNLSLILLVGTRSRVATTLIPFLLTYVGALIASTSIVICMQTGAVAFDYIAISALADSAKKPADPTIISASTDNKESDSSFIRNLKSFVMREIGKLRSKYLALFIVVLVVLVVIGGGYASLSTQNPSEFPLLVHFIIIFLGVGLVEESSKLLVAYFTYNLYRNSPGFSGRMTFLFFAAFAGLAFGTGEALIHFIRLQQLDAGFSAYLIRAFWCVPLHMIWVITSAVIFYNKFMLESGVPARSPSGNFVLFLFTIAPAAILHGLYDAFALREMRAMWFYGAISAFVTYAFIIGKTDERRKIMRKIAVVIVLGSFIFSGPHLHEYFKHKVVLKICDECYGNKSVECQHCSGSAQKQNEHQIGKCVFCNGAGRVVCNRCNGSGQIFSQVTLFGE